jgi:hypothetical protein
MLIRLRWTLGLFLVLISLILLAAEPIATPVTNQNLLNDSDILVEFDGGVITREDISNTDF